MKKHILTSLLFIALLTACSKKEPFPERETIIDSAVLSPTVGGPNQPNQVYVHLSSTQTKSVRRDSWDLAFYSGEEFRVNLNSSVYMATKKLETSNIDGVTSADVSHLFDVVKIGTFDPANVEFVDDLDGNILNSAIDEISIIDDDNKVYLLNLGYNVGTTTPNVGSVAVTGTHRGWKKIRILKRFDNYLLQYADLDETTHHEVIISKNNYYNFTFFSFNTADVVDVEPKKNNWDMNFTVFANEIPGNGTYGYTDFILTNSKMNVKTYKVTESADVTFNNFDLSMVNESLFSNSQRNIGSKWRSGGGPSSQPSVYGNIFFVLKDTNGAYYKIKFIALTNELGERGYPQFQYKLLQ